MILLIKLVLAHIIGDFFLQPKQWVNDKEKKKLKSPKLYLHIAVHVIGLFVILWDLSLWPIVLVIGLSHFIIDATKLLIQKKKTKRLLFFLDQLLHLIIIFVCYSVFSDTHFHIHQILNEDSLLLITFLLFLSTPASIIMRVIFSKWDIPKLTKGNKSLKDAGKYIGVLERLLVFIFIVLNQWEAVGFLIAAKSVFRFGDLTASKHRKLTEYILIGTLLSFSIAIAIGLLYKFLSP